MKYISVISDRLYGEKEKGSGTCTSGVCPSHPSVYGIWYMNDLQILIRCDTLRDCYMHPFID